MERNYRPGKLVVLHCLLAIFSPSIPIVKYIHLASRLKSIPTLSPSLLRPVFRSGDRDIIIIIGHSSRLISNGVISYGWDEADVSIIWVDQMVILRCVLRTHSRRVEWRRWVRVALWKSWRRRLKHCGWIIVHDKW